MSSKLSSRLWVTSTDSPTTVFWRARNLLRAEGLRGLVRGVGRFAVVLGHRILASERYRIYEFCIDEAVLIPAVAPSLETELRLVEKRDDITRLVAEGYQDISSAVPHVERRLESGAIAACAFVGKEFASIDWMAFSETAKLSFDQLPYKVDFASGEVSTGGAFTVGQFRRRGIATYRFSLQMKYMHERGCTVFRSAILDENIPSQRIVERYGGQARGMGHWRRLLWLTSWKETAVK